VAGCKYFFKIGTHERFAAADIHLKNPGGVDLVNKVHRLCCGKLIGSGMPRGGEAMTAFEIALLGHFPSQINRGAKPHFNKSIAH
jgi:hypothetical protein